MKDNMEYLFKALLLLKNSLFTLVAGIASFVVPLQPLVVVTTMVSILDYFVKLYCIYKTEGKAGIKSNRMQDTMYKILLYAAFLFVTHIVDVLFVKTMFLDIAKFIFSDGLVVEIISKLQIVSFAVFIILMREVKSIDENWEQAFNISFIDLISSRFSWLFKLRSNDTSKNQRN